MSKVRTLNLELDDFSFLSHIESKETKTSTLEETIKELYEEQKKYILPAKSDVDRNKIELSDLSITAEGIVNDDSQWKEIYEFPAMIIEVGKDIIQCDIIVDLGQEIIESREIQKNKLEGIIVLKKGSYFSIHYRSKSGKEVFEYSKSLQDYSKIFDSDPFDDEIILNSTLL